ncbi:MAG: cytochrome c3 family protein [Thermodesulfobacteriota bacterium]
MKAMGVARLVCVTAATVLAVAPTATAKEGAVRGVVKDGSQQAVAGAMVYLVPAADVVKLGKAPSIEIRKDVPNDEPLEDNLATGRDKYAKGTTDKKGAFTIGKVADGKYFVYVEPMDGKYLPGGDLSAKSKTAAELTAKPLAIQVSGKTPADATFVGSSTCLKCHNGYKDMTKTLHKIGISVIDKPGKLQDHSRFPNFNEGLKRLSAGTRFYFSGFDKGRGFDKYLISEKAPADAASVDFTATFFRDADGKLKFRTENVKDPADTPRVYTVEMTYGGGLYKQRYLYRSGNSLFPFVQYNPAGDESFDDRTRKPWRDYHADWLFNAETKKLTDPPTKKSFESECASCHYNGYSLTPTVGGGFVAGAVNDPNGEADIDGDGVPNELNIGCEACHGPGSAHAKSARADKSATIVNPRKLASERATVICDQCHSRPQGNLKNDQPVSKENRMLIPGISRNDYLIHHTTREDAAQKDFWGDGVHSKSHHQQGTDLIRSKKYINGNRLMTCTDCHDPHGKSGVTHQLRQEVRDGKNSLCASCHKGVNVTSHTAAKVGMEHEQIHCVDCHVPKTMQTGAGLGKGLVRKDGKNYWVNDISSHLFDVPRKNNKAVAGIEPGKAMPIPYTNGCGGCHDVEKL